MGNPSTAAGGRVALLEPPGFMMLNYGPRTPLVTLAAHIVYETHHQTADRTTRSARHHITLEAAMAA